MKKVVSIILVAVMLLSMFTICTHAEDSSSKISTELQEALNLIKDKNKIEIVVTLIDLLSEEADTEIHKVVTEELGYTLEDAVNKYAERQYTERYNQLISEFYQTANADMIDSLNISEYIQYKDKNIYRLSIPKNKVNELALSEYVVSIDLKGGFILPDKDHLYEMEFREQFVLSQFGYVYDEIYYHYGENLDAPDWILVDGFIAGAMWDKKFGTNVGDRILYTGTGNQASISGYLVYVAELDTFIPIEESEINKIIELCPDFVKVIEENGFGQLVGDIDENNVIDITDVTYIQRYLAGYRDLIDSYPIYYHISIKGSIDVSDFDRDGETTVLDATAIQRHIAGIE